MVSTNRELFRDSRLTAPFLHFGSSFEQVRNGSAFVHAVGAVHNIFEAVIAHREAKAATLVEEDDELAEADIDNPSLYVENFRNKCVVGISTHLEASIDGCPERPVPLESTARAPFRGVVQTLSNLCPLPSCPQERPGSGGGDGGRPRPDPSQHLHRLPQ
jgi:hypothetical protein